MDLHDLRVVGWGCSDGEMCAFCDKNEANVYVVNRQKPGQEMIPACNICVPPGSCPDPIAGTLARAATALAAH